MASRLRRTRWGLVALGSLVCVVLRFQFEPASNDDETSDHVELDQTVDGPEAAKISATFLIP